MRLATLDIEGRSQAAVETSRGFVGLPFSNVGDLLRVPRWREIAEQNLSGDVLVSISEAIYLSDTVHIFSKRPAEIKKTITIDLPHPRKPTDRYTDYFKQLELDAGEALGVLR